MIQNVERFRPELHIHVFLDRREFHGRKIDIRESRSGDDVSSRVSETARVPHECGFIEPLIQSWIIQLDGLAWHEIRSIECEKASASIRQKRNDRTERISGLQIHDRRNAPT